MTMFDLRKGVMLDEGCLVQSKDNNTSTCQRDFSDKNFTHQKKNKFCVGILHKFTSFLNKGAIYLGRGKDGISVLDLRKVGKSAIISASEAQTQEAAEQSVAGCRSQ